MGKLTSVALQQSPEDQCAKCGKPVKSMNCCKNEFKYCKVTESHQAAKAIQQHFSLTTLDLQLPVKVLRVPAIPVVSQFSTGHHPHDPPDITAAPVFLLNCTFLI
ncbi:hypothetical protein OL497_22725 [Chitinophaga sp. PC14]|uniref:Uncharacterized protein n=2 Tax=Chitinophaga nivalis TaxID=2991709 RepID=A0ABT3IRX9_9BACT|nr:hypothetical protein [Chitinophaga nivalis]MCW3486731.1 hypothetical protein [Chitinophaga nivalis]